ncbi:substrate-specific activator of APC-dependent proteolysis [Microbotryomycetes sp. JL221]|nr:substrate-specific activator of APC-dependent proteolysis [Microbotryomycetes sp. JL221]
MHDDQVRRVQSSSALPTTSMNDPRTSAAHRASSSSSLNALAGPSSSSQHQQAALGGAFAAATGTDRNMSSYAGLNVPLSPSKKRIIYGDRRVVITWIETPNAHQFCHHADSPAKGKRKAGHTDDELARDDSYKTFQAVLKTELFGPDAAEIRSSRPSSTAASRTGSSSAAGYSSVPTPSSPSTPRKLFSFTSPQRKRTATGEREKVLSGRGLDSPTHERYSLSPVRHESQRLLLSPKRAMRKVSRVPFKVLDAPELADDFYLNLVDWSAHDELVVGLASAVYTWSATTLAVKRLCDLSQQTVSDSVTSVAWVQRGSQIAVGTRNGSVQIWDANHERCIRRMSGHSARVGALAWNDAILTSGSHDRLIYHRDVRLPQHHIKRITSHKQEVCGLKWNDAGDQLASGGNDNKLFVFSGLNESPLHKFTEHTAAVKAIAWSPHQNGILASGGGTQDMKLRIWNTSTGQMLNEVDTGSQICNLLWSKTSNELVSTHGFSTGPAQNQVILWKYPSLTQIAQLQGHTYRVLYLAASPNGQTIVTGAGDETLRFWAAFPPSAKADKRTSSTSSLNLSRFVGIR